MVIMVVLEIITLNGKRKVSAKLIVMVCKKC